VFYGSSECGGITYDREGGAGERGTLGTPVEGVRVDLERQDGGSRVVVTSLAVAERYLPEPDELLAGGSFRTADLAEFAGGELRLTGRLGSRINVRGKKVDPREIEAVIASHAAVEDVRVVGVPRGASGDETLRAVVACPPGAVSERELYEWCRASLADFKVPRSICFVERLPTNARGKVELGALARLTPDERDEQGA
jgi:acyl-CoA synthetase (AMP-forming)/AMP-acid ligase II